MKKKELKLKLEDIYGGDGFERADEQKEVKLDRSKQKITVREDLGIPVKKEKTEKKVETKEISVRTFKRDDDGTPMYRIGGNHGKLWGALKEAGESLYQMGKQESKVMTERILKTVKIKPQWVRLEMDGTEMETDTLPQILNTAGNSMVEQHFDVIPECTAEVTITYPDNFEQKVEEYLELVQTMGFGNKRRGSLKVVEMNDA